MTIHNGPIRSNKIGENARFSVVQSNNTSIKPKEYIDNGTRYPLQVLDIKRDSMYDIKYHPTQKPVELLEYLIKTYTNEGDVVLDFCMGSGSTGVACLNTKRHFIGIEKDENYFKIATKRINDIKNRFSCEENE
jgi:site-specific DNA-methyltransferase (adenine-specific)